MTILNSRIQKSTTAKELAENIAESSRAVAPSTTPTNGLFSRLPRRTGKSTFLRQDLVPEAENQDWLPIYVDLWADQDPNPAELIAEAIAGLDKHAPVAKRALLRAIGISKWGRRHNDRHRRRQEQKAESPSVPHSKTVGEIAETDHAGRRRGTARPDDA